MHCNKCGERMMQETVIILRRKFGGFRENRSQGAYCLSCRIAVPIEAAPPPVTKGVGLRGLVPMWLHGIGLARVGRRGGGTNSDRLLSLAR
jgi:hypothetical protein